MVKRELIVPLAIIGVSAAFLLVSSLVAISGGHPWFVRKKLRIGMMLITLLGMVSGCSGSSEGPGDGQTEGVITCYVGPMNDHSDGYSRMSLKIEDLVDGGEITIDLSIDNILEGNIRQNVASVFSFLITDDTDAEHQRGTVQPVDGRFNESYEEFTIEVRSDLASGDYRLYLYVWPETSIDEHRDSWKAHWYLHVINE